jgi:hypothetical protein
LELRQRDDRRTEIANPSDRRRDRSLPNGKERARDRRDRASGACTLRTDLKQGKKPRDDDDADQREKFSFVSVREDDRSAFMATAISWLEA